MKKPAARRLFLVAAPDPCRIAFAPCRADVCADDQRIRKPGATLAGIGKRNHLPDAQVQRLDCPAEGH